MGRFFLRLIPWWVLAAMAVLMGLVTVGLYEDHRLLQAQAEQALRQGPPPATPLQDLDTAAIGPMGEVRVTARIRSDLGIMGYSVGDDDYAFIALDDGPDGPLMVITVPVDEAEEVITQVVAGADARGGVQVNGFLSDRHAASIDRALQAKGQFRPALNVSPYFGDRAAAINGKESDAQFVWWLGAAFTGLFAVMTVWKFRSWRTRRAARRGRKAQAPAAAVTQTHDVVTQTSNDAPVTRERATPQSAPPKAGANPWGTSATGAPTPPRAPQPQRAKDADEALPDLEAFESVFPGGGSGFRFKTADEIIRETFGTVSRLSPPESAPREPQ